MYRFFLAGAFLLYICPAFAKSNATPVLHDFDDNPKDLFDKIEGVRELGLAAAASGTNITNLVRKMGRHSDRGLASAGENAVGSTSVTNITNVFNTTKTDRALAAGGFNLSDDSSDFQTGATSATQGSGSGSLNGVGQSAIGGGGSGAKGLTNLLGGGGDNSSGNPGGGSLSSGSAFDFGFGQKVKELEELFSSLGTSADYSSMADSYKGSSGSDTKGSYAFKNAFASANKGDVSAPSAAAFGGGGGMDGVASRQDTSPKKTEAKEPQVAQRSITPNENYYAAFPPQSGPVAPTTKPEPTKPPIVAVNGAGAKSDEPHKNEPAMPVKPNGAATSTTPVPGSSTPAASPTGPTGNVSGRSSLSGCEGESSNKCAAQCKDLNNKLSDLKYTFHEEARSGVARAEKPKDVSILPNHASDLSNLMKAMMDDSLCCPRIYGISWGANKQLESVKVDFNYNNAAENLGECKGLFKANGMGDAPSKPESKDENNVDHIGKPAPSDGKKVIDIIDSGAPAPSVIKKL